MGVGSAAVGAYGANRQAHAAQQAARQGNGPYSETSTSTSATTPYGPAGDQINSAFDLIRQEYERGAHQQAAASGRGGGARAGGGAAAGGSQQGSVVVQNGVPGIMSARGVFQPLGAAAAARYRQQGAGGGATPAAPGGPPSNPEALAAWFAQQAAGDVAHPSRGITEAQDYAHDTLTGGTDEAPFARNPILNDLYGRLQGADFDRSQGLLEGFLGGSPAGGAAGGGGRRMTDAQRASAVAHDQAMVSGQGGTGSGAGTPIPDTMDDPNSWFVQQVNELYDPRHLDPANDPTMQGLLDAINRESAHGLEQQTNAIGDEATGLNMYGGSGFQLERGRARGDAEAGRVDAVSRTLAGSREQALLRRMQAMGLVSDRDLASMQDATNRYSIDSAASSAGASSAAANATANRSLDLQAILGIQGMDQFGLSGLGDLGGALSGEQHFAAGDLTPTLEALRGGSLERGFGMADTLGARAAAQRNAAANRADANRRATALAPGQDLDDYLSRLTGLANPYGVTTTTGSRSGQGSSAAYAGPSPTAAAITGGLGAGLAAWGAFQGTGASRGYGGGGGAQPNYTGQPGTRAPHGYYA